MNRFIRFFYAKVKPYEAIPAHHGIFMYRAYNNTYLSCPLFFNIALYFIIEIYFMIRRLPIFLRGNKR